MVEIQLHALGSRTIRGATWMIAWRMVTRVLGLGSTLVLARILVPADFGLVAMATTFSAAIDSISTMGLQDALIRRPENDHGLYNSAFSMQVLRGFATAIIIAVGAWPAGIWFGDARLYTILLVLAAVSAAAGFENIAIIEFRRSMRFDMEFRLLFVPRICQVIVTVGLALTLRSYWALVAGIVVTKLLRLMMTYVIHPYRPRFALGGWRDLIGFSFWTWMGGIAALVWDRADPFIIGPALGPAVLGVYLLAAEVAVLPITELVAPATAALFAGVARMQDRGTDTVSIALSITSTLLLLIVPLSICISGTSGYVVAALLGTKWQAAQPLIAIFSLACIFSPFSFVSTTILVAKGHVRQNFQAIAASAAIKVVVLAAAVTVTHRANIVAFLAVGSAAIEFVCFMWQLCRLGDTRWRASLGGFSRTAIAGALAAMALYATGYGWRPVAMESGLALLIGGALGCGVFLVFVFAQMGLWLFAGQPDGPEARALAMMLPFFVKIRARLQRNIRVR